MPLDVSPGPFARVQQLPFYPKFEKQETEGVIGGSQGFGTMGNGPASAAASTIIPPNPGGIASPHRAIPALSETGYTAPTIRPAASMIMDDRTMYDGVAPPPPGSVYAGASAYDGQGGYGPQRQAGFGPPSAYGGQQQPLQPMYPPASQALGPNVLSDNWGSSLPAPRRAPPAPPAPPAESVIVPGRYSSVIAPRGHLQNHTTNDDLHRRHTSNHAHRPQHQNFDHNDEDWDRQTDASYYSRPKVTRHRSTSISSWSEVSSVSASVKDALPKRSGSLSHHPRHHSYPHNPRRTLVQDARDEESRQHRSLQNPPPPHAPGSPLLEPLSRLSIGSGAPPPAPSSIARSTRSPSLSRRKANPIHHPDHHHHHQQPPDEVNVNRGKHAFAHGGVVPNARPQLRRQQSLPSYDDGEITPRLQAKQPYRRRARSNASELEYEQPQMRSEIRQGQQQKDAGSLHYREDDHLPGDHQERHHHHHHHPHHSQDQKQFAAKFEHHPPVTQHLMVPDADHRHRPSAHHVHTEEHAPPPEPRSRHHSQMHRRHESESHAPSPRNLAPSHRSPSPHPMPASDYLPIPHDSQRRRALSMQFEYERPSSLYQAPSAAGGPDMYDDGASIAGSALTFMDGAVGGRTSQYGLPKIMHQPKPDPRRFLVQRGNADVYLD